MTKLKNSQSISIFTKSTPNINSKQLSEESRSLRAQASVLRNHAELLRKISKEARVININ